MPGSPPRPAAALLENLMALPRLSRRRAGLPLLVSAVTVLAVSAPLPAQRAVPSTYAITNARIVPVSTAPIARGTIVIRNGLIAAVGTNVAVPADARVIDGAGLTVYPGFIDAYGSLGLPSQPQGGGGGRGGAAPAAGPAPRVNSSYPPGLQPEVAAIDQLRADADAFAGAHNAGFTTALTASQNGIFQGQSALINLTSGDAGAMVVKAPIAQHIGFTPLRAGGYPSSLMGVFASLRQALLDAQHYRDARAAYDRNPRGMQRPDLDVSLEALQPVLARQQPVVMFASTQREIERALDLAKEFNIRPIIAGGADAHLVAARLKAENVPVLLTTNFPRRTAAPSADADPDPIRVLRQRVDAPKVPAQLAQAGVRFALQSGGTSNWGDVLTNVHRAIENGLSPDAALRALTMQSAEILGVSDRLGSIEQGKIANLTVARGDLMTRSGRVTQLFIDGRPVTVQAAPVARSDSAAVNASGTWTLSVNIDNTDRSVTLSLRQEGNRLLGSMQGMMGSGELVDGSIGADGTFRFSTSVTIREGTEEATFVGTIEGNQMRGRLQMVGHAPGIFSGTRPAPPSGAARNRPPQR
jgi:imidazolonepropionase-like amidohydrolase